MKEEKITIGRGRECDIILADESVSRYHAELVFLKEGRLLLIDCKSKNGTFLVQKDKEKEVRQELISPLDTVQFGDVRLSVTELLESIRLKHPTFAMTIQHHITLPVDSHLSPPSPHLPPKNRVTGKRLVRCQCGAVKNKQYPCPECGK